MRLVALLFVVSMFIVAGCSSGQLTPEEQAVQDYESVRVCQTDADCVPADCCHPTQAVNREFAPDCSATLCSAECVPDTLDCGQGKVVCFEGLCEVAIFDSNDGSEGDIAE